MAQEIGLPRLTVDQTATVASAVLGRPAPAQIVAVLHERSDGIPLHVEELLAAAGDPSQPGALDAVARTGDVPDTMADALLTRLTSLDDETRDVAAAAAVIGRSFDFDLLAAVTQQHPDTVFRCLRHLQQVYLVQAGPDAVSFDFRHALIRDAVYGDVPLPRRRQLHESVARVAAERGYPDAFLSAHYDLAGLGDPAYEHALRAARHAAALSAHRQALELYRRALRNLPRGTPPLEHAALLTALGNEAAAVDDNTAAAEAYAAAGSLLTEAGDPLAAAAVVPAEVAVAHLLGDGLDKRSARLERALASLDGVPDADPVRARLLAALSAAYMLDRRLDESLAHGERSRSLSREVGDEATELNVAATVGSVLVFAGRMDEGWAMLQDGISRSVAGRYEAEAARGYRMVGSCASVLVEYDSAERWLAAGIDYAGRVELWNHRSYMAAHLAHVRWATGEWDSAQELAEHALADGRGGITTRITAGYVLGYLALGRGDWDAAVRFLEEAYDQGDSMDELQRVSPAMWGLAETALLRGDHDEAARLCERGLAVSQRVADAAYLFPFLVTGTRTLLARGDRDGAEAWVAEVEAALRLREIPGTMPAIPHARGLLLLADGDDAAAEASLGEAASAWQQRRRFWEGSWALLDRARCSQGAKGRAESAALLGAVRSAAEPVGATPLLAAADDLLALQGRRREDQPWHPLTEREHSVATLVAAGMTNREIAAKLVVSPKTVSAHVEHILTKLGAARRAEIAAWVTRIDA